MFTKEDIRLLERLIRTGKVYNEYVHSVTDDTPKQSEDYQLILEKILETLELKEGKDFTVALLTPSEKNYNVWGYREYLDWKDRYIELTDSGKDYFKNLQEGICEAKKLTFPLDRMRRPKEYNIYLKSLLRLLNSYVKLDGEKEKKFHKGGFVKVQFSMNYPTMIGTGTAWEKIFGKRKP